MQNPEDYYLERCRQMAEEKLGWGSSDTWSHHDFVEASEKISEEAGITLSVTTIKRIWGKVKYKGTPATSTLNALALYLGFENWRSFKLSQEPQAGDGNEEIRENQDAEIPVQQGGEIKEPVIKSGKRKKLFVPFFSALILLTSMFWFLSAKEKEAVHVPPESIVFSSEPLTTGLPNTVVFNYDISAFDFDSAFIQQNWDSRRRQRIEKENKQITSVYYYPGHFNAKLVINDQVVKEHGLLVPTDGWLGLTEREGNAAPVYIPAPQLIKGGVLHASREVLEEKNIDTRNDFRLTYSNARDYGADGDHFTFEAAIRNNEKEGGGVCQESSILIDGETGIFYIPLASLGCVGNVDLQFSDVFISGQTTDLSAFGTDLSVWNDLRCIVKNKQVELLLNGQPVYSLTYNESIGKVMGINFRFQGAGEVDYVRLKDKEGKVIYEDEFSEEI